MSISNESSVMLEAMVEHEIIISQLYKIYAEKFPEYSDFWMEMCKEENGHASWIKKLWKSADEGSEVLVVDRFPLAAIEDSMRSIKKRIRESEDPGFQMINALSIAVDIEQALIENHYFEVFAGDSELTKKTLGMLAKATAIHLQTVRKMQQENR